MAAFKKAVIVTTTFAKATKDWEAIRADCALKTMKAASEQGYLVVSVDGGSPTSYIQKMQNFGASVFPQILPGMGNARREAFSHAMALNAQTFVWLEPEKYPMIPFLARALNAIEQGNDLAMFRRSKKSMASYPPEQALAYTMCALAFKYLHGFDCDYGFGPLCMSRRVVEDYILSYTDAYGYGDLWDSIHIPKLRAIQAGLPYAIVDIDYQHPPEQTAAETGVELFLKRVEQISSICDAVFRETRRLKMP